MSFARFRNRTKKSRGQAVNRSRQYEDRSLMLLDEIRKADTQMRFTPKVPDIDWVAPKRTKVVNTVQSLVLPILSAGATIETDQVYVIHLNDFSDSASYINCFDAYRIMMIEIDFLPLTGGGHLYSAIDYDDNTPLNITQLQQYNTFGFAAGGTQHTRVFKPRIAETAFSSSNLATSSTQASQVWIDAASNTVPHYGLKVAVSPSGTAGNPSWSPVVTAWIQFRDNR